MRTDTGGAAAGEGGAVAAPASGPSSDGAAALEGWAATAAGLAALEAARGYARAALSAATLRAYAADWAHFEGWCRAAGAAALPAPPEAVAAYLASLARTHGRAALRRRLAAIGQRHRAAGAPWVPGHPAVRLTLRGLLRTHGAPPRRAAALGTEELRRMAARCGGDLAGARDRALLLLGYAGALRRSELAAVDVAHLDRRGDGSLRLLVPRSKGDPEGEGEWVAVPRGANPGTCPVRALEDWLRAAGIEDGPAFRPVDRWGRVGPAALHPDGVRRVLLRRAAAAGVRASGLERLSPHGLRAGFVTEAYRAGARDEEIMGHSRHKDLKTMRGYVRRSKLGAESPARLLGL